MRRKARGRKRRTRKKGRKQEARAGVSLTHGDTDAKHQKLRVYFSWL